MKQLVIVSGKGGTGKTSLVASFAHLASHHSPRARAVFADADVDAANLELVLAPDPRESHEFWGKSIAEIDPHRCEGCGICHNVCRFDAVLGPPAQGDSVFYYRVDPLACEGCAACFYQCPVQAIRMVPQLAGQWFYSETPYGPLFHAALRPAQENSGKLVSLVKQQALRHAENAGYDLLIVDGPPGIGCPAISAVSGADLALIVAEPSVAGIHDLHLVLELTAHFHIPTLVCINKADIHPQGAAQIESFCAEHDIEVVGSIPFDPSVSEAITRGLPVTVFRPSSPASQHIERIWQRLLPML